MLTENGQGISQKLNFHLKGGGWYVTDYAGSSRQVPLFLHLPLARTLLPGHHLGSLVVRIIELGVNYVYNSLKNHQYTIISELKKEIFKDENRTFA